MAVGTRASNRASQSSETSYAPEVSEASYAAEASYASETSYAPESSYASEVSYASETSYAPEALEAFKASAPRTSGASLASASETSKVSAPRASLASASENSKVSAPRASKASASGVSKASASEVVEPKKKTVPRAKQAPARTRIQLVPYPVLYSSGTLTSDDMEAIPPGALEQIRELKAQLAEKRGEPKPLRYRHGFSKAIDHHYGRRRDSPEAKSEEDETCRRHSEKAIAKLPFLLMTVLGALGVLLALGGLFWVLVTPERLLRWRSTRPSIHLLSDRAYVSRMASLAEWVHRWEH